MQVEKEVEASLFVDDTLDSPETIRKLSNDKHFQHRDGIQLTHINPS